MAVLFDRQTNKCTKCLKYTVTLKNDVLFEVFFLFCFTFSVSVSVAAVDVGNMFFSIIYNRANLLLNQQQQQWYQVGKL